MQLDDGQRAAVAARVQIVLDESVISIAGRAVAAMPERRTVTLASLAVAEHIAAVAGQLSSAAARMAAETGASYGELGAAAGITRQGARRRWPDLAEVAAAARRNGRPAAATPRQRVLGKRAVSRYEREVEFEHSVDAWTVGQLREALVSAPADAPLMAVTAEKPGGDVEGERLLVCRAELGSTQVQAEGEPSCTVEAVILDLDFPSGVYNRTTSSGEDADVQHEATALTVSAVQTALDGLPEDTLVRVYAIDEIGDEFGSEQVVYDAEIGTEWVPPARGESDGEWVTAPWFELQCDFPPGTYVRYEQLDGEDG